MNYILKHYGVNSGFMRKKVMNPSFPGHAPGKDTLRAANAATERGLTGENARANAVSGRALSPVKIKFPVATADMRRHSDTLRGAQRRRKRGSRGENGLSVSDYPLSSRPSSLSPVKIKIPVASADIRRHSDTLRAANAAMKERFTGRKQNKRKRILFSPRRSPKVGANGGENARASVLRSEGVCSPVKIKFPVATADMRRHSDTLRAANAATKVGVTGRKRVKRKRLPVVFPSYNFTSFRDTPSRY